MTRVIMPMFLRQEGDEVIKSMMHYARMLQGRLVDNDRQHQMRVARSVKAEDIVAVVGELDALCRQLDSLVGGSPSLRDNAECMRHTMEFRDYCEREFAHEAKQRRSSSLR